MHSPRKSSVDESAEEVRVWDLFVRIFHWSVTIFFFIAYFTEDDTLTLHVWAGYAVGALVLMRILWGFVGPKHARFRDFIYSPFAILTYLAALVSFRAKRYLGHSPAGGAMTAALLLGLLGVVWSGLELYAAEEGAGPLATVSAGVAAAAPDRAKLERGGGGDDEREKKGRVGREGDERGEREGEEEEEDDEYWEELHESLSNLVFFLVVLHVLGVLLASIVHKENLTRGMITGCKRAK